MNTKTNLERNVRVVKYKLHVRYISIKMWTTFVTYMFSLS